MYYKKNWPFSVSITGWSPNRRKGFDGSNMDIRKLKSSQTYLGIIEKIEAGDERQHMTKDINLFSEFQTVDPKGSTTEDFNNSTEIAPMLLKTSACVWLHFKSYLSSVLVARTSKAE